MKINPAIKNDTWATDLEGDVLYFPVRRSGDDGHEFICLGDWGADREMARRNAEATDLACGPSYAKTNPLVRIALLKIIACEAA